MSKFQNDSIFWIEVDKVKPNPYQPRKHFSDEKLGYLADSIRQYGVLQPLVVTRKEVTKEDGGLTTEYELIAGERRLRASKLAGVSQVPAIIREAEEDEQVKLELAIIENLQREDLNPIDRALAFQQLADEFSLKHTQIAKKVGKSREYVSNSLRLLSLPDEMRQAISNGQITEGHARPILMLKDRPEEQETLFKEIIYKKLTVRDAEAIARKVAYDKVRKKSLPPDPEMMELEGQLAESFGTRVQIERKEVGGKLTIDFFSNEDLKKILDLVHSNEKKNPHEMLDNYIKENGIVTDNVPKLITEEETNSVNLNNSKSVSESPVVSESISNQANPEIITEPVNESVEINQADTPDQSLPETDSEQEKGTYMMGEDFKPSQNSQLEQNTPPQPEMNSQPEENIIPEQNTERKTVSLDDGVEIIPGVKKENQEDEKKDDDDNLYSVKDFTV